VGEVIQRFKERFEMWRDEQRQGSSGPPAGRKIGRNPLLWGVFLAIGALIPPYHTRSFIDMLIPAAAVVFLVFYVVKSRFAWHVLAAEVFCVTPLYVILSPSWRLQTFLHPSIIWFPIISTCVFAGLLFWSRGRYFAYLEQQRQMRDDQRI